MDQVEVSGLSIAYIRAGDGPLVVLLPGYVGDAEGTWHHQIAGLSDEFTVVAWDTPGSGQSSDPPETFRLPDLADCLAGFVNALDLGPPHIAGLSFGGGLALELYRRHPTIPRSLVLAGAYAGWAGSLPPEVAEERLRQVIEMSELPPEQFVSAVLPSMFSARAPRETVEGFAANAATFHPVGLRVMARSFAAADLRDVLTSIEVPTLLLYGDQDVRAPLSVGEEIAAAIPMSRLVVMPGVGHASALEAPTLFNGHVRDFLRTVTAAS